MEESMMENGKMIINMERVNPNWPMELNMKEIGKMVITMDNIIFNDKYNWM